MPIVIVYFLLDFWYTNLIMARPEELSELNSKAYLKAAKRGENLVRNQRGDSNRTPFKAGNVEYAGRPVASTASAIESSVKNDSR